MTPLYLLIEGDDDEMFFNAVIKSRVEQIYSPVHLWKYASEPKKRIVALLKSINKMKADYLFIRDLDQTPCVTLEKQKIGGKYPRIKRERIFVVIKEIESWFLAGVDSKTSRRLRIKLHASTEAIGKEEFERLIPKRFSSRIDFMLELLKFFSFGTAKQKNESFAYFVTKNAIAA